MVRCPWCNSDISRSKFLEIEAKIRDQEQKKLAEVEAAMRKSLDKEFRENLAKKQIAIEKRAEQELATRISKISAERDQFAEKTKQAELIRKKELQDQHAILDKDRDHALLKQHGEFNREREGLQKKMKEMERQLQRKTLTELGDGAEIDLFEALRKEFPGDQIARIKKGQPGADILHKVMYKGECCGRIIIDSKNRQAWNSSFISKLRLDQTEAGADHALLTTTVFPSGRRELCIEAEVVIVNPARACHVINLLRRNIVTLHVRGLGLKERASKMSKLYKYIGSEAYAQRTSEIGKLSKDILELDVQEKKSHDNVWKKRGSMATRINNTLREIETDVAAIIEGSDHEELSVA
jgi:hypothetical protein